MQIIWIGSTKPDSLASLNAMYLKRLAAFVKIQITELQTRKISNSSDSSVREDELLLRKSLLRERRHVVLLSEEGVHRNSREFATWLERSLVLHGNKLTFVLGGAFGFSPELKAESAEIISLSPLTFSHQLARLVLLEQLYRAFTIIHNHPYHNA